MVEPPTAKPIRILHLEDNAADAVLIRKALTDGGVTCEITRVQSRDEFIRELDKGGYDLIITDFTLPSFDGAAALQVVRKKDPDIPFIYASGTIGEEAAVRALLSGATDYVIKNNLNRLVPAVQRAMHEADQRKRRQQAEEGLRRTEEQLKQAQKMESIGRLAGGVAHDFNNVLTAILGFGTLLQNSMNPNDARSEHLKQIIHAANRAATLTRQLLAFSRKQVMVPTVLNLNSVIENMEKMLRRIIGEDIDLAFRFDPVLKRTKVDAGQMEQVIMNLSVNSRDAMPEGGKLTIETRNMVLDAESPSRHDIIAPGSYVLLAVSDNGCGMDEKVQSHLFEPFFTTKELGKGTGLGLSTVYGIVKQSGGYIWVYSEVGRGTTFKIYLPSTEEAAEPVVQESIAVSRSRGSETVLLVEDDTLVQDLLATVLQENGYTVLVARTGEEALRLFESRSTGVDLVVTDVVMPKMGGRALSDKLKALRPDLKVIFMSGYTDDAVIRHGELSPGAVFIQKPLTPNVFLAKVRETLDREHP